MAALGSVMSGYRLHRPIRVRPPAMIRCTAMNPDLSAFKRSGGKLLIYHGWNDGASGGSISPLISVEYYSSVLAKMGPRQEDWLRLFMVPGMAHCGGGPGPNQFNALAAVERWRESGTAPDQID